MDPNNQEYQAKVERARRLAKGLFNRVSPIDWNTASQKIDNTSEKIKVTVADSVKNAKEKALPKAKQWAEFTANDMAKKANQMADKTQEGLGTDFSDRRKQASQYFNKIQKKINNDKNPIIEKLYTVKKTAEKVASDLKSKIGSDIPSPSDAVNSAKEKASQFKDQIKFDLPSTKETIATAKEQASEMASDCRKRIRLNLKNRIDNVIPSLSRIRNRIVRYCFYFAFAYFGASIAIKQGFILLKDIGADEINKRLIGEPNADPLSNIERLDNMSVEALKIYKEQIPIENKETHIIVERLLKAKDINL